MPVIKILPHHVVPLFEVYYLGWNPNEVLNWYDNEAMKQNGVLLTDRITKDPGQLVQIVRTYDEICKKCPYNRKGDNYTSERICEIYQNPAQSPDFEIAQLLGLEELIDAQPVTAKTLFELMLPTYEKFLREPKYDDQGKKKSLRMMFRVKEPDFSNLLPRNSLSRKYTLTVVNQNPQ